MSPVVIADSDDESDSSEHAVPAPLAAIPQAQTRSSEHASLATASTDSIFFQQVYNEQHGAACERTQQLQRDFEDQSSAMTIPDVPFQRTTGGFYHSSTTSAADHPHIEKFQNTFIGKRSADRAQSASSEKKSDAKQSMVDPWEVPSSPEALTPIDRQQPKGRHRKALEPSCKRDEPLATKDALSEGHWDAHGVAEIRDSKRRRLDDSDALLSTSNDVDLIMMPSSGKATLNDEQETAAASSIPLPTMPLDADSTFYLRQPSSIESPQSPHFDVDSAPNGIPKYNNLLLKQQTQYAVRSSGTATNINTPRSQMFSTHNFSSMAPEEHGRGMTAKKIEYRNIAMRRDSSPDIISTLIPGLDGAAVSGLAALQGIRTVMANQILQSEPEHSPDLNPASKPDQECCDERDSSAHQPPPQELQSEESDAEFVAQATPMAKSKKKRGRPKKRPESDEPLPTKSAASPAPAGDAPSAAETKRKKRGRPKKQSTEQAVESAPPPADPAASAVVAGNNTSTSLGLETDSIQATTKQNLVEMPSEQGAVEAASAKAPDTEPGRDWAAPGTKGGTKDHSTSQSASNRLKGEESKEPKQPAARGREEKSGGDKKGPSAQGTAKPLYRVGLSKRFKIAPLLKSVRKP